MWIALATVVGLAGIWQAKVAIVQGLHHAGENLPPPLKTRVAVRSLPIGFTGDEVEIYVGRGNKGLTDREIETACWTRLKPKRVAEPAEAQVYAVKS